MIRCQAGNSGQCVEKEYWGVEGGDDSCSDGSDLYRPIKKATETEESGRQATQADSNEHGSDDGEERINNDESFGEEAVGAMGAADKRDSAETDGGQHSKPEQVWKTWPKPGWKYNRDYKGEEEGEKYVKERTTGLWMIPESDPFKVPSITEEDFEKGPEVDYERKEEFADFYSIDNYVKDETTNRRVAAPTEETCKANNGFVCKVRLDADDVTSIIMMMTIVMIMAG